MWFRYQEISFLFSFVDRISSLKPNGRKKLEELVKQQEKKVHMIWSSIEEKGIYGAEIKGTGYTEINSPFYPQK